MERLRLCRQTSIPSEGDKGGSAAPTFCEYAACTGAISGSLNANTPFEIGDHDYPLRSDLMAPYMGRLQEFAQAWDARVPNMRVTASPFFDGTPEFNWKPCSAHLGHGCCKRNATQ